MEQGLVVFAVDLVWSIHHSVRCIVRAYNTVYYIAYVS